MVWFPHCANSLCRTNHCEVWWLKSQPLFILFTNCRVAGRGWSLSLGGGTKGSTFKMCPPCWSHCRLGAHRELPSRRHPRPRGGCSGVLRARWLGPRGPCGNRARKSHLLQPGFGVPPPGSAAATDQVESGANADPISCWEEHRRDRVRRSRGRESSLEDIIRHILSWQPV